MALLIVLGILSIVGIAASVAALATDGYRAQPTDRSRIPAPATVAQHSRRLAASASRPERTATPWAPGRTSLSAR